MQLTDKIELSDDVVAREVAGEIVLLDLASGTYFGLNQVGGRIWQMLESEDYSLADVASALQVEFDVSQDRAESDVLSLVGDLSQNGLLRKAG